MWQLAVCPEDRRNKQRKGGGGRLKKREKCVSQLAATQPTCKFNQLRSMRKWLALRKNNLGASKETLSLMHNSKLGHHKSGKVCVWCVCSWSDYLTKKQSVQHSNQGGSRTKKRTFLRANRKRSEVREEGWLEGVGDAEELSVLKTHCRSARVYTVHI